MTRICCAHGAWQLATLVAGLRQAALDAGKPAASGDDYLILYGAAEPPSWVESVRQIAGELWNWKAIVWVGDLLVQRPSGSLDELFGAIRQRIGTETADQVWIWTLNGQSQKLVAEAYPQSRLTLYEDGLHTYVMHQTGIEPGVAPRLQDRVRLLRRRWVDEWDVRRRVMLYHTFTQHLKRVNQCYLYLAHDLKLQPPYSKLPLKLISDDVMRQVLADMACAFGVTNGEKGMKSGERRALVLGQCFAKIGAMSEEAELVLYQKIVGKLLESGYTVYWKDHPRVEGLFYAQLQQLFPGADLRRVDLPPGTPVELAAEGMGLSLCVAATSSSLFYLPRLYNVECYTLAKEILPMVDGDLALMTRLTIDTIPSVDKLLQSGPV